MIPDFEHRISELKENLFSTDLNFEKTSLDVFRLQAEYNPVYKRFISQLNITTDRVKTIEQIPFLPVQFFKTQKIVTEKNYSSPELIFESSGTTGAVTSRHYISDVSLYRESYLASFNRFYGEPADYCLLALLPSYAERQNSSLIYMADDLVRKSNHPLSGFYLHDLNELSETILQLIVQKQKFILLGVTYALLDLAEHIRSFTDKGFSDYGILMETGGMKGRRKEMVREEVHETLKKCFGVNAVHSEYGMTELLSQAYSSGNGIFQAPPWMKVIIRDANDPFRVLDHGQTGGINIIDLANIYSCSFIAVQDLGKTYSDGTFEVMGRFDTSDLRGCNLLVQ